jgi:hypothetical protein
MENEKVNDLNVVKGCHNLTNRIMNGKKTDYWNLYHKADFKLVALNDDEFNQVVKNNTNQKGEFADIIYVRNEEDAIGYLCVRETFLLKQNAQ